MQNPARPLPDDLVRLQELVVAAARAEILPCYEQVKASRKADGSVITAADLAMQERLRKTLTQTWPQYPVLGEEMPVEEQQRLLDSGQDGLWCLDPLDGTSNFALGIPFFAVSLALIRDGLPQWAMVYDPMRNETFAAVRGQGAWLNGQPLQLSPSPLPLGRVIATIDLKRLDMELRTRLAQHPPYSSQRSFGSSALEWCWLAAERFRVYLHGGQQLWDHAAGGLILTEAGGCSVSLAGDPVFQLTLRPRSAVAAVSADLLAEWCAALKVPAPGG
jgi:myo-inositol-1(or 4)-monophosphatase